MKRKLTEMITRSLAFVLSLGIASGAWADSIWNVEADGNYSDVSNWTEAPANGMISAGKHLQFLEKAAGRTVTFDVWDGAVWWNTINTGSTTSYLEFKSSDGTDKGYNGYWPLNMANGDLTSAALKISSGTYYSNYQGEDLSTHVSENPNRWCWGNGAQLRLVIEGGRLVNYGNTDAREAVTLLTGSNSKADIEVKGGSLEFPYGDFNVGFWCDNTCSSTIDISNYGVFSVGEKQESNIKLGAWNDTANNVYCYATITVNIKENGTLKAWNILKYGKGTSNLNFDGGTLQALGVGTAGGLIGSGITVTVGANGGTIDVGAYNVTIAAAVTGAGTITKKGTGTLTFTGDMSGFIGKVAVANGAGSVTLPATATRARAGDYTSVAENQDGTFTFSYYSNGSAPAATQYAELLNLDFEDEATYMNSDYWSTSLSSSTCAQLPATTDAPNISRGTRSAGGFMKMTTVGRSTRGVTFTAPYSVANASEYNLEFYWFASSGYTQARNHSTGFAIYDSNGTEIMGLDVPVGNGVAGTVYKYDSTIDGNKTSLGTISTKRGGSLENDSYYWHHVVLTGSEESGLLSIVIEDGSGNTKVQSSLGEFKNIGKICFGVGTDAYSNSSGIDDLIATTPAVAGVDGVNYATFAEAVAAATSTSTITLYSDVALTSNVTLPYSARLVLNGYALYTTDENVAVTFNDGVHYLESTIAGGYKTFSATVTMDDTVYVWTGNGTGNSWGDPANWNLGGSTATSAPAGDVEVLIPAEGAPWTINVAANASVSHIAVNGDTTLSGGTLRATTIDGAGTITLSGASFGPVVANGEMSVYNDLKIVGNNNLYMGEANNTAVNVHLYGDLSGNGTLTANHAQTQGKGVKFHGNNAEFYGTFATDNYSSRDYTGVMDASASSANAVWKINTEVASGAQYELYPVSSSGVHYYGAFIGGAYYAEYKTDRTIVIGGRADVASDYVHRTRVNRPSAYVRKVGNGDLTFAGYPYTLTLEGGTTYVKKATTITTALTFAGEGATLQLVLDSSDDSYYDPSAVIKNSTSAIAFDSNGNDYTWASQLASSNVGGLTKKGAGTLTLTQMPTFTGAITVEEGALVLPAGYSQTLGANTVVVKDDGNTVTLVNGWVITWDVDGVKTTTPVKAGEMPTTTDPTKDNYTFAGWDPAVVAATADATYTATWTARDVTLGTPEVTWGLDFTNAVVTATVTDGYADVAYTLTYGQTTVAGTVKGTTVTFNVPVAENARYANFNYSIAAKVNNESVGSVSGPATIVADEKAWFSTKVIDTTINTTNGSWATVPTVAEGKMTFTESNTFTPTTKSSDDIVVITMEDVIFGDINDAEITGAQAGIRISESGKFQVLTTNNAWQETSIEANGEEPYDVVLTINYATKKYSVKIGTGTKDDIMLAGSETGVNAIEFNGSGSLASLAGEAYDGNMVVDNDGKKYATVEEAIAALKAGTATAPLTMLHDGTAPAGWTIENDELTKAGIVVDGEVGTGNEKTFILAVPKSTAILTAATLINTANRVAGDQLKVYDKSAKSYYSWQLAQSGDTLVWDPLKVIVATDAGQSETNSPGADAIQLTAGQGVWVTVKDDSKTVLLNGQYAGAEEKVEVALETGWNLVAPPPKEGEDSYSINSVVSAAAAAEGDRIVVPTAGVPYNLTKGNDGKWGYYKITTTYNDEKKRNVTTTEWVDEVTVPSGTGFWYINGGDSTKNISL